MSKSQVNFRLPDALITALRERAEAEGKTTTEIAIILLESGLGLSSTSTPDLRISSIEERIASQLLPLREQVAQLERCIEERISVELDKRISETQELLPPQLDERIENRIQLAIQKEMNTMLGECAA